MTNLTKDEFKNAGEVLRETRLDYEWTQSVFADMLDIKPSLLSELETGKRLVSPRYIAKVKENFVFRKKELKILRLRAALDYIENYYQIKPVV